MSNRNYTENEVQYLTEIAFVIGELHCKDEMTALENDRGLCMDYEDFTDFCINIFREAEGIASQDNIKGSLLDYIYDMISKKEKILRLYKDFLHNYR